MKFERTKDGQLLDGIFIVITPDQHVIHRRTRVNNQGDVGSNPAQGNYSFFQKLSSVEFPVTFSQFLLNLDCEPFAILLGVIRCWLKGST